MSRLFSYKKMVITNTVIDCKQVFSQQNKRHFHLACKKLAAVILVASLMGPSLAWE